MSDERIVIADRFPAVVHTPGGARLLEARVVLTRDELFVWQARGGEVQLVTQESWSGEPPHYGSGVWAICGALGEYRVERGGGCGCSSPLRRFVPWTPWRVGRP